MFGRKQKIEAAWAPTRQFTIAQECFPQGSQVRWCGYTMWVLRWTAGCRLERDWMDKLLCGGNGPSVRGGELLLAYSCGGRMRKALIEEAEMPGFLAQNPPVNCSHV
jgi:hypothetical protein